MQDRMTKLSYVKTTPAKAKVVCLCGWESTEFVKGPFDPNEALVAYSVEHLKCNEKPPELLYIVGQHMYGKLHVLGEPIPDKDKIEEIAKGLCTKGRPMHVLEVKILSTHE